MVSLRQATLALACVVTHALVPPPIPSRCPTQYRSGSARLPTGTRSSGSRRAADADSEADAAADPGQQADISAAVEGLKDGAQRRAETLRRLEESDDADVRELLRRASADGVEDDDGGGPFRRRDRPPDKQDGPSLTELTSRATAGALFLLVAWEIGLNLFVDSPLPPERLRIDPSGGTEPLPVLRKPERPAPAPLQPRDLILFKGL